MKKIGLLTDVTEDGKIYLNFAYFRFAEFLCEQFPNDLNGITLIHPHEDNIDPNVGLFIGIGGADISPYRYGFKKQIGLVGNQNANLEYFDVNLLPKYLLSGIPSLHICRSMQAANIFFYGTLKLHVDEPTSNKRSDLVHLGEDPRTKEILPLISLHHQAIDVLGNDFEVILNGFTIQKKKRIDLQIEAIRHKALPILGLQTHPEEYNLSKQGAVKTMNWILQEVASIIEQGKTQEINLNPINNVGRHFQ